MFRPDYKVKDKIRDIEKVFNYLDSGLSEDIDLEKALSDAENTQQTKKIKTKYFLLTFFKKGTCHIEFRNLDLLAKFNLFGSQKKGWIPPSYMKEDYNNMSNEERDVVDSFEGKDSYSKKMKNKDYYNFSTSNILRLNS